MSGQSWLQLSYEEGYLPLKLGNCWGVNYIYLSPGKPVESLTKMQTFICVITSNTLQLSNNR